MAFVGLRRVDGTDGIEVDVQGEVLALRESVCWGDEGFRTLLMRCRQSRGYSGQPGSQAHMTNTVRMWEDSTDNVDVTAVNVPLSPFATFGALVSCT